MRQLIKEILTNDDYVKRSDMSVTDINRGTKEIILSNRYEDEKKEYILTHKEEQEKRFFSVLGNAFDAHCTKVCAKNPERYITHRELYYHVEYEGKKYTISGEIDAYIKDTQTLIDFKLFASNKLQKLITSNPDTTRQLNGYKWLINEGVDSDGNKVLDMPIDSLGLLVGLRDHSVYSKRFDSINPLVVTKESDENTKLMFLTKLKDILDNDKLPDDDIKECSQDQRWEKPSTYPVFKLNKNKTKKANPNALPNTNKFKSIEEAQAFIDTRDDKDLLYVDPRIGGPLKCKEYCIMGKLGKCNYYNKFVKGI